ncbi:bile acid:sodium symporter family protein [Bacillus sp. FJAT-50079]|uniref:bile acid:sodium symporter family protein n=1 Tax=Bacillus sp. FJAT-50079 TaxID=2833577 RepID=UPI001BC9ED2B|nr:bile acid:sodium symporter family protein [Bacillus sp. FJAT-50079]MBS4209536.1 bile acid:sodium symporter family protein [Bacillus sp. FJAT-50079]
MLEKLNKFIQKWMPILTPLSLIIGVLLENVGEHLLFLVSWLFAFMTFVSSLGMKFKDVKVFVKYPKTILFSIAFLHIIMPLWAYFLSKFIFQDHLLTIGFVIAVAVPTGVTSVIWVTISKGNLPLCLSIVLIDTLISPIVMPALLQLIVGESIAIDSTSLVLDLVWMIVLPSILGILLNELSKGSIQKKYGMKLAPFSKLCLFGVIMINSSAIAPYLRDITWELIGVILLVFIIAVSGYVFTMLLGRIIWKDQSITTTFVFTGGMRNIAVGVIIATTYFPSKVAMPVVFGMLFQQVLASVASKVIEKKQVKMFNIDSNVKQL